MCKIIAVPPGATIKELLEDRHITPKKFAERAGLSKKYINKLLSGEAQLTREIAERLENILGVPVSFWINL